MEISTRKLPEMPRLPPLELIFPKRQLSGEVPAATKRLHLPANVDGMDQIRPHSAPKDLSGFSWKPVPALLRPLGTEISPKGTLGPLRTDIQAPTHLLDASSAPEIGFQRKTSGLQTHSRPTGRLPVPTFPAHTPVRAEKSPRDRESTRMPVSEGAELYLPDGPVRAKLPLLQFDSPRVARLERSEAAAIREMGLAARDGLETARGLPEWPPLLPHDPGEKPQGGIRHIPAHSGPKGQLPAGSVTRISLTQPSPQQVRMSEVFQDTHLHMHQTAGPHEGMALEGVLGHLAAISRGIDRLVKQQPAEQKQASLGPIQLPFERG